MASRHQNRHEPSPFEIEDPDGVGGNVWGWKFSNFGIIFIVLLLLFMWYRFESLGVSPLDSNGNVIFEQDSTDFFNPKQ